LELLIELLPALGDAVVQVLDLLLLLLLLELQVLLHFQEPGHQFAVGF